MFGVKIRRGIRHMPQYNNFRHTINQLIDCDPIRIQEENLRETLIHCYEKVPFYSYSFKKAGYNPNNYKGLQDLEKIPYIDKQIVKENYQSLIARTPFYKKLLSTKGKTSGTTGSPASFLRDLNSIICEEASINWHWTLAGWPDEQKMAVLRGNIVKNVHEEEKIFWDTQGNDLILSSFHLNEVNFECYIDKLHQFSPHILRAYPSTAYLMAKYLEERDEHLNIPYLYTGSEPFYPIQRQLIKKRLRTRIMDFYGQAERVAFGFQPHFDIEDELVLLPNYSIVEVVDYDKNGNGIIVGTTLNNFLMPLIRYKTDDRSRFTQTKSKFSKWKSLEPIYTKNEDYIIMHDGRKISGSLVTFVFKDFPEITKSKIVQFTDKSVKIYIVRSDKYSKNIEKRLLELWKNYLNADVPTSIEVVDFLPLNKNAKFKWIEANIPVATTQNSN